MYQRPPVLLLSLLAAISAASFAGGGDGAQYLAPEDELPDVTVRPRKKGYQRCVKCDKKRSRQSSYCQHCGDRS